MWKPSKKSPKTRTITKKSSDAKVPEVIAFASPAKFNLWLKKHHAREEGIWLRMYKKASGTKSMTYAEALDEALCFGWIDGQSDSYDSESWIQKFTPRRKRSMWSKRNIEHVTRLRKEGRMQPSGEAAITAAKKDGRWEKAYDGPGTMTVPEDFLKELSKNKKATAFFESLNKANVYAITWRLQTAKKPETREKRMKVILAMLKEGKKFH